MAAEVSTVTVTIELACEADFEEVDRVIREAYAHDYGPSTQGTARPDPMLFFKTAPHMTPAHHLYDALGFIRAHDRDGLWIGGEKQFDLFSYVMPLDGSPA